MKARILPPLLALALGACEASWVRPGTSAEQADRDYALCHRAARAEIPPRMERRQSAPERVVTRRVCQGPGGREPCRDEFVRREAARYDEVDANASARRERADDCMRAQGYRMDGVGVRLVPPPYVLER